MRRPISARNRLATERSRAAAMTGLGFGCFEFLRIDGGQFVLALWPAVARDVKLCSHDPIAAKTPLANSLQPENPRRATVCQRFSSLPRAL
jgi:hypothetical protein